MNNSYVNLIDECDKNLNFFTPYLKYIYNEKSKGPLENSIRKYEFYLVATILDLCITLKNIVRANCDWERIYFTKSSFLIIYESSIHIKKLSERDDLKNYIKKQKISSDKIDAFSENLIYFIESEDYKFIELVRNKTSAHLDDKINIYYETIYRLDGEKGAILSSNYLQILQDGFNLINQLRKQINFS